MVSAGQVATSRSRAEKKKKVGEALDRRTKWYPWAKYQAESVNLPEFAGQKNTRKVAGQSLGASGGDHQGGRNETMSCGYVLRELVSCKEVLERKGIPTPA